EAIYLADRIVVMTAGPGKIKELIDIGMPRPRNRANPAYGKLSARILDMLEEEVEKGQYSEEETQSTAVSSVSAINLR
ncbi:MAG: hypothetical protein GX964_04315, partial [Syntrophomonadaceae bacterium]|nr:hypothetical protein [Syntrophomonadaceae bacterium]